MNRRLIFVQNTIAVAMAIAQFHIQSTLDFFQKNQVQRDSVTLEKQNRTNKKLEKTP